MDEFTVGILLSAVKNGASGGCVNELINAFSYEGNYGPTEDAIAWFKEHRGKRIKINGTSYHGVVHALNESQRGLYPGGRLPIYVKLDDTCFNSGKCLSGMVFEYGVEQLTLKEVCDEPN